METACVTNDATKKAEDANQASLPVNDSLKWSHILPQSIRRALFVGAIPAHIIASAPFKLEKIASLDQIQSHPITQKDHQQFDCILVGPDIGSQHSIYQSLSYLSERLNDNGQLTILIHKQEDQEFDALELDQTLTENGLIRYRFDTTTLGKKNCHYLAIVAVKSVYNPILHARMIATQGRPDIAIDLLNAIPQEMTMHRKLLIKLALEKQQYYFSWMKTASPIDPPHALFSKERREFAQVTVLDPMNLETYYLHAQTWAHIGRPDMARRLLRSIGHVDDHYNGFPATARHSPSLPQEDADQETPLWNPSLPAPRILIITHEYSDYGMDTLYHGLCTLIGSENIIEYPWKPTLHGQNIDAANNYPCVFSYPGEPESIEQLELKLRNDDIDLILFGDVVQMSHATAVRRLINANPHIPVILYDTWDDCYTPMERVLRYIGRKQFDVIFKREMIDGLDYGQKTYPLPFGYAQQMTCASPEKMKTRPLFWAGKKEYGLRPLYIDSLEIKLGTRLDRQYDQKTYLKNLRESHIGLSLFGCGFDSVRYWELPANGVMLMSERPPIRIPHNFKDGHSAVFFDDLLEMDDKLNYYMRHPEQSEKIAAAGHAHYLKHHTTLCRARQMLGVVHRELGAFVRKTYALPHLGASSASLQKETPPTYLGLVKGENYGWGICSKYLIEELPKWRPIHVLDDKDGTTSNQQLSGPLFQALTTVNFQPLYQEVRGSRNYGYTFFENELTEQSVENANQYDLILTGSSWCRDRMLDKGISNSAVLIQGIDPQHFYPIQEIKSDDRFVIFSGGKFELRKGQDLVLKAVSILQDKYPDVYLANCWFNLWVDSLSQMTHSPYISFSHNPGDSWVDTMQRTYHENGLDLNRTITMELIPHHQLRSLYVQTDIGVFPNRCEGGSNLVLMEYMACAKPVIATYTSGHKDIVTDDNALLLRQLKDINIVNDDGSLAARWQDPSLDELVSTLEYAYHHRDTTTAKAKKAGEDLLAFTWANCAQRLSQFLDA